MGLDFPFDSHFQFGGHSVISDRKVLPPGECTCSVCPAHIQQRPPVPDRLVQFIRVQFTESHSTFVSRFCVLDAYIQVLRIL